MATPSCEAPALADAPYRAIYDRIIEQHPGYNDPTTSPGYRACLRSHDRIRGVCGPALDVGCGVGFVVQLLGSRHFELDAFGVDVSAVAVARAAERAGTGRISLMEDGRIPHPSGRFGLVTCFDVLEHLDERDIRPMFAELRRVLRPGGLLYCSIATRASSSADQFGVNLHRTVRDALWWCDVMQPDELHWDRRADDLFMLWTRRQQA